MTDHLTDEILVRRADGELSAREGEPVEEHLAACDRCRAAAAEIDGLARRFSRALALVDPPASRPSTGPVPRVVRARARRSPSASLWRAAAVVALLAGTALAIPPVRAWMADRLGLASVPEVEAPVTEDRSPDGLSPDDALRIAFLPDGDRFVVRLSVAQATGRLTLSATAADSAVAELRGASGDAADLLVLPDGLRIRNRPASTADYTVVVPLGMSRVEVWIGDRLAWSGPARLLRGGPVVLQLDAR